MWQGSEYASAKFHRVLNMPQTLNMPRFWICHGTEYAAILNMQQLHTVLNFRECAWISINILAYVWIIVNKQASEYNVTSSACYFVALSNTENQLHALFISKTWLKLAKMKKMLSNTPNLKFWHLKIIRILHLRYQPKIIELILKISMKTSISALIRLYD